MEEDADFRPPKKKRCTRKPETQFLTMSEEEMAEISKVFVPANTAKNTQWAVSVFREWRSARSSSPDDGQKVCPADLLENPVVEDLNYWICRGSAEPRWKAVYSSKYSSDFVRVAAIHDQQQPYCP
jgi:hypothetical protein